MLKIRHIYVLLLMLLSSTASAALQMSVGIGLPNVSIGINVPVYPSFVVVPGSPVYYAPQMDANFFFYDGLYWVYQDDNWYESSWYNGPWWLVDPDEMPLYVLRVPVRYYRMPPTYFIGWQFNAPPRWGDHWGHDWSQRRSGWDRWDHHAIPARAPLPSYQRQFKGDQYPKRMEQQDELHQKNYKFQSRDPIVREKNTQQHNKSEPTRDLETPRENVQQKSPNQGGDNFNRNKDSQPNGIQRGEPNPQAAPTQKDDSDKHDQQSPKSENIGNQKPVVTAPPQRNLEPRARGQNQEQRVMQKRDEPQPTQRNKQRNNQNSNTENQPKQNQGQERGKGRSD